MDVFIRKTLAEKSIEWYGDLESDCAAQWAGLTLRAEEMDTHSWWWAVYDNEKEIELASSYDREKNYKTAFAARQAAENTARIYIEEITKL